MLQVAKCGQCIACFQSRSRSGTLWADGAYSDGAWLHDGGVCVAGIVGGRNRRRGVRINVHRRVRGPRIVAHAHGIAGGGCCAGAGLLTECAFEQCLELRVDFLTVVCEHTNLLACCAHRSDVKTWQGKPVGVDEGRRHRDVALF